MALKSGRVGVNPSEVDSNGRIKSSGSGGYTKQQADAKFETKAHIGGLQFRESEGNAQYKLPNGDWVNFNSGGTSAEVLSGDSTYKNLNVSGDYKTFTNVARESITFDTSKYIGKKVIYFLRYNGNGISYGATESAFDRLFIASSVNEPAVGDSVEKSVAAYSNKSSFLMSGADGGVTSGIAFTDVVSNNYTTLFISGRNVTVHVDAIFYD